MKMFTYLLYCMEILVEGEAVKRYNRQTKDIAKKRRSGKAVKRYNRQTKDIAKKKKTALWPLI